MVRIRLSRHGSKRRPYYHIVVSDSESARDGRFIEQLGTYDPRLPREEARINRDRLNYWIGQGAQLNDTLKKVVRDHGKALSATSPATATA